MEQRNIIEWSKYSEYTELTIPSGEIWMSESELVDLFGVFIPKLRNTIQNLYTEELVRPYEAERTIKQKCNLHLTVYNMEVVMPTCLPSQFLSGKGGPQGIDGALGSQRGKKSPVSPNTNIKGRGKVEIFSQKMCNFVGDF